MKVVVAHPDIKGDSVRFRWTQSEPNPFQQRNEFYIRYEGVDLTAFTTQLFYEVFLGLQLKVFAAYPGLVQVVFPEPIPYTTAAYWSAFHHADRVAISPIDPSPSYSPWTARPHDAQPRRTVALFYGGGRDSTLVASLLTELYPPDQIVLIQFIGPLRPNAKLAARLEQRQERLMLGPSRERMGVATQRVWTDYQAQFLRAGYSRRPHLELYTVGALPALLASGITVASFCHVWTDYPIARRPSGTISFRREMSRPEVLRTQSKHYRVALGADLTVTNLQFPFSSFATARILAQRYPRAFGQIVMCTQGKIDQRWCYNCRKCVLHAIYCLFSGFVDQELDFDRLFAESLFMRRIMAFAESGTQILPSGNASCQALNRSESVLPLHTHAIALAELDHIADQLGSTAMANLVTMKALFGNQSFPNLEPISIQALELLDCDVARKIARIGAEHVELTDKVTGPFPDGVQYDLDVHLSTRMERLDHIRMAD